MELINNIDKLLGDDLKNEISKNSKISIAASFIRSFVFVAFFK